MMNVASIFNQFSPLDESATLDLLNKLKSQSISKGDFLLKEGNVCRYLFYIEHGLTKTCFTKDYKEFIMRFFPENSIFTVLDSFITQTSSTYSIVALEKTSVSYISHSDVTGLCRTHHCFETFFRKLVSLASINMMKRISEMLEENGTERYKHFVEENNQLLQRVSLGDLASYLGITQVSLSRIRAKK